jgi:hypothetical protein
MRNSISKTIDRNRKAIAGVEKQYANLPAIVLDGVTYKPADVVKILQGQIDAIDTQAAAKVGFHQTAAAQRAASATANAVFLALKTRVFSDFKNQPDVVGEFGLTVPTRHKPKPPTLVKAAEKSVATRKARHTLGPKAKLDITGDVPATPAAPKANA